MPLFATMDDKTAAGLPGGLLRFDLVPAVPKPC